MMMAHPDSAQRVLLAPVDPGCPRIETCMPAGLRLDAIVASQLPGASDAELELVSVSLVTVAGVWIIPRSRWHLVRPAERSTVVIRVSPGKGGLRTVLQIVVAVAAIAIGQYWGAAFAGAIGVSTATGTALLTLGIQALGGFLINAIVPPPSTPDKEKPTFAISNFRNELKPDAPVPDILGRHRFAPPYAAKSWSEVVGDLQYFHFDMLVGYAPLVVSEVKIGETPIDTYEEVDWEIITDNTPSKYYPTQVLEENDGTELRKDRPLDDFGEEIDDSDPEEVPVRRFSAADASGFALIFGFPGGLGKMDDEGDLKGIDVALRIRIRREDSANWTVVQSKLLIKAKKREAFFRSFQGKFPTRGRYEIEVTRTSANSDSPQRQDRLTLVAVQSFRPEPPINFSRPVVRIAGKIRATYQLNGALDTLNCVASRIAKDWDAASKTWILRETRNPASLDRYLLQGPGNPRPQPDSRIDLAAYAAWHEFNTAKGLHYDKAHDYQAPLGDVRNAVCAAGRASPRFDGTKHTVVVDRPRTMPVDHINSRNARAWEGTHTVVKLPDAFRVRFLDETNGWKSAERLIPSPTFSGTLDEVGLTEDLAMPGKTNPAEIYREAKRRFFEVLHRPTTFRATQDGAVRVAERGDLVMASFDTLSKVMFSGRVKRVTGQLVELDRAVDLSPGAAWACRFLKITEADEVGESVVRAIEGAAGETFSLALKGTGQVPDEGSIVMVGPAASEALPAIVLGVEPGEDFSQNLSFTLAAPVIDELTDAVQVPAWNGRVGQPVDTSAQVPAVPRLLGVDSGVSGTDSANGLVIRLRAGENNVPALESFEVRHRLFGGSVWATASSSAAAGAVEIPGYLGGNTVEFQPRAISGAGTPSPWGDSRTVTIGAQDTAVPGAILAGAVSVSGWLGHATLVLSFDGAAPKSVQIYHNTTGAAPAAGDKLGAPLAADAYATVSRVHGDGTRSSFVLDGGFSAPNDWDAGDGWEVAGGKATHAAGAASELSQPATALESGQTIRFSATLLGVTAGAAVLRLSGGSPVEAPIGAASGTFRGSLVAATGNNALAVGADSAFAGSVDDVIAYRQTTSCIAQGAHFYWVEPLNADGQPGPRTGPFTVSVI